MKIRNDQIFMAQEPLRELIKEKFPLKTSYGLAKLAQKLSLEFKLIEDVRNGLIQKYGQKGEDNQIKVTPESPDWEKFVSDFNELMGKEVEVVFDKVKIAEKVAGTCDKCNHNMDVVFQIEPQVLMALDTFITVE